MKKELSKFLYFSLIFLAIFIPFREFMGTYINDYIKFIPDILILINLFTYLFINKFHFKLNYIDIFFLLFIGIGLLSTVVNGSSIVGFIAQVRSISVMYCLFFLMRKIKLEKQQYNKILKLSLIISAIIIIIAIGEFLFDKRLFFPCEWAISIAYESNFNRIYGLLNNPNTFAIYILLINVLLVYYLIKLQNKIKFIHVLYFFLSMLTIFLTASRSSFILVIIGYICLALWLFLLKQKSRVMLIFLILFLAFGTSVFINNARIFIIETLYNNEAYFYDIKSCASNCQFNDDEDTSNNVDSVIIDKPNSDNGMDEEGGTIVDRFEELFSGTTLNNSKIDGRIYNILLGLNIFADYPVIGTGFGTFGGAGSRIAGSYLQEKYGFDKEFYTDNEYIKVLVEVGVVGTIIYCLFLFILFVMCLNSGFKLLLFFILLFLGLFYNIFEVQILMFYIYFAFVYFESQNKKTDLSKLNNIYNDTKDEYYKKINKYLKGNIKKMVVTANPETMVLFDNDTIMKSIFDDKNVDIIPDGIGIVISSRIVGNKVKERITGVDLVEYLLKDGNKQKKSVYFFGAKQEVIDALINVCKEKYPNLKVVGAQNGYVKNRDEVFGDIVKKKPDICLVALGIPHQEKLIYKYLDKFDKGIFVGVGGSFDVLSGLKQRAPKIFIKLNLEWFYRIVCEPKRLKRFYNNNIKYVSDILNNE